MTTSSTFPKILPVLTRSLTDLCSQTLAGAGTSWLQHGTIIPKKTPTIPKIEYVLNTDQTITNQLLKQSQIWFKELPNNCHSDVQIISKLSPGQAHPKVTKVGPASLQALSIFGVSSGILRLCPWLLNISAKNLTAQSWACLEMVRKPHEQQFWQRWW